MESLRRAFTLIELLAVIAIVAILAALLFPVFASAKDAAKGGGCLVNLSQIDRAARLYAADADDRMPLATDSLRTTLIEAGVGLFNDSRDGIARNAPDVRDALAPYGVVPRQWRCGLDAMDAILVMEGGHRDTWFEEVGSSYFYDDYDGLRSRSLTSFEHPSHDYWFDDRSPFHPTPNREDYRAGFSQAVYFDGHAGRLSFDDHALATYRWDTDHED